MITAADKKGGGARDEDGERGSSIAHGHDHPLLFAVMAVVLADQGMGSSQ